LKTAVPELKENSQRHTNLKGKGRRELKLAIAEFEGEKSASYKVRGKREMGSENCYSRIEENSQRHTNL